MKGNEKFCNILVVASLWCVYHMTEAAEGTCSGW